MKLLLDECIPKKFREQFSGHECLTVREMDWTGLKNGQLLAAAENLFEVFLTVDKSLRWQQHLPKFNIAVLLIRAKTNRLPDLIACVPEVAAALRDLKKGEFRVIWQPK